MKKIRAEVIALFGGKCERCGYHGTALQFDHVAENGHAHRLEVGSAGVLRAARADRRLGGKRFQLLCANCNWEKRYENEEWAGRQ